MKSYSKKLRSSINQLKWKAKIFKMIDLECERERWVRKRIYNVDHPYDNPSHMLPVPQVGEVRHFFDDGKMGDSRHYMATITKVITYKKASQKLKKVWKEERRRCYWIYAYETDYFIKASIPEYDKKPIWFVRTKDGGWFSIDYMGWLMSGRLMRADFNYEEWKKENTLKYVRK